jgi:hypothetical protein
MIAGLCAAALGCGKLPLHQVPLGGSCETNDDCTELLSCIGGFCTFGPAPLCTPDTKQCNGDFVETCASGGDKWNADATPCATGCQAGACKPAKCQKGTERKCDGQIILQCNGSGTGFEYFQSCPAGCTQTGQNAECKAPACSPFETKCEADAPTTLFTCDSRGTKFVESACPTTPASICVGGRCAPKAAGCSVTKNAAGEILTRTQRCNGVVREQCNNTETGWDAVEVCEYGCDVNSATGAASCAVPNCKTGTGPNDLAAPFETRCSPDDPSRTTLQRCNARGTAWENITCSSTAGDAVCDLGRCVPKVCAVTRNAAGAITARDQKCDGDFVVQCNDAQSGWMPAGAACQFGCSENSTLKTAQCAAAECSFNGGTNPQETCDGLALMRCTSRGTYAFVQYCPSGCATNTPSSGRASCRAPTCNPLSRQCVIDSGRNFVELCRADGTGFDRLEECPSTCTAGICTVTSSTCVPGDVRCRGLQTETCVRLPEGSTEWRFTERCLGTCNAGQCDAAGACGCAGGTTAALPLCSADATSTRQPISVRALLPDEQNLRLPCDGTSRILVYTDPIASASGQVVPDGTLVTFTLGTSTVGAEASILSADADPNAPGLQRPTLRGRARVVIRAPANAACAQGPVDISAAASIGTGSCGGTASLRFVYRAADSSDPRYVYLADDFSTSQLQDRAATTAQWDTVRAGVFAVPAFDLGDGRDGDYVVGADGVAAAAPAENLSIGNGRVFGVTSVGTRDVAVDNVLPPLSPGDEILLTTIWGNASGAANIVGNYEFKRVASVATGRILFTENVRGLYGTTNSDLTGFRVIAQRVPNFRNVTIFPNGTLTTSAPAAAGGPTLVGGSGIIAFRATGTVRIAGKLLARNIGLPNSTYTQPATTTTALNRLLLGSGGTQAGGGIVYVHAGTLSYRATASASDSTVAANAEVSANSTGTGSTGGTIWLGAGRVELGSAVVAALHNVNATGGAGRIRFDYSALAPEANPPSAFMTPVSSASNYFVGQAGAFTVATTINYEEPANGGTIRTARLFKMLGGSGATLEELPMNIQGSDFEASANDGSGAFGKVNDGSDYSFILGGTGGTAPQGQKFKWRATLAPPSDKPLEVLGVGFRIRLL